jgi:hypothetical protein
MQFSQEFFEKFAVGMFCFDSFYSICSLYLSCKKCSLKGLLECRLVEEADFRSTAELFGKKDDEKSLDSFIPKSESDFLEYAELISNKLRPFEVC